MKTTFLSILLLFTIVIEAQDKKAYQLFDKNGKKVSYKKLLKSAESTQVVLFGEFHNRIVFCFVVRLKY